MRHSHGIKGQVRTMMTLEEAIEHAEDIATSAIGCECREEHRQLAAWLRELSERRKAPEIITCEECVHSPHTDDGKILYCKRHARYKLKDYFCGDAERRTE